MTFFAQQSVAQTSVTSGVTNAGYALNTSAIAVDPGIVIASATSIAGFKVTISSGLKSSDVLAYAGTLPGGITVTPYNSNTGVITFNGTTTAANWQTLLRTVTYANTNTGQFGSRTITFSAGNLSAYSNGHFYELVSPNGSWTASKANAAARSYLGMTGYLATITSIGENAFIRQVLNADAWMGCSDEFSQINAATGVTTYVNQAAAEGNWYWVTGPEKGTMLSVGNITPVTQPGQFANWNNGEPNNAASGEHYGEIYSSGGNSGAWNDLPFSSSLPYVVEYGGSAGDPVQDISASTVIYTEISANTTSSSQILCGNIAASTITGATPYGGEGTYTYQWISSTSGANTGFSAATGTNNTANYSPGTLAMTTWFCRVVTSGSLVDTSAVVAITVNPAVTSTSSSTNVTCNGASDGTASISVSGGTPGFSYVWTPTGGTSATETGLTNGTYSCVVTDAAGCTTSQSISITEPGAINVVPTSTDVDCNLGINGSASVSVTGGAGPYTYVWTNGATTNSISNITAGIYEVTITDGSGCTEVSSFTIAAPNSITATVTTQDPYCFAGEGTATVVAAGGTGTLTYNWSSGGNLPTETNLLAGTYTVTITDANGCTREEQVSIISPTQIQNTVFKTSPLCNGGTGSISVITTGGIGSYTYLWSNGSTNQNQTGLIAGSYDFTVTDGNGCKRRKTVNLFQPSALVLNTAVQQPLCNGGIGAATVTATGGTTGYTYVWSTGGTTSTEGNLTDGTYQVVVTDQNGCSQTTSATVTAPTAIAVNASSTNELTGNDGTIDITVTGGTPGFTYAWDNGATTEDISGLTAGDYTVIVTDANGCTFSTTITVSSSVGIFDPVSGAQIISIYPNPSTGVITLAGIQSGQYRVVDALGRMMTSFTVQQQDLVNVDLSEVSNGLYYIQSMKNSNSFAKFNIVK